MLHSHITDIVKITRDNFPNSVIKIVTNGILLDKQDNVFWECCRLHNVIIAVTPYPINLNIKKIIEMAEKHGVELSSFGTVGTEYKTIFRKDVYELKGNKNINIRNPVLFCRYCNIEANKDDVKWSVSKKELSEWT